MLNVETRVVDENMNDVVPGRERRDRESFAATAERLLQRSGKTAAAFSGGWFHSGDSAVRDEGGYITTAIRSKICDECQAKYSWFSRMGVDIAGRTRFRTQPGFIEVVDVACFSIQQVQNFRYHL